jgi:phage terminase large subunit-like protein
MQGESPSTTTIQQVKDYYRQFLDLVSKLPLEDQRKALRHQARTDLYYLLRYLLNRPDLEHIWLWQRCQEVQKAPDGYLDLWARGHYKSTIITFAKTVQDILGSHGDDPLPCFGGIELTFGIFSHSRGIAKAFLRQIRDELEKNVELRELFPDILYEKPERDAPRWSEDSGIVVKRKSNPKEATVEAWGLVDGQPTSKHFNVLIHDDAVTVESVSNPEMVQKTTDAWALSLNLGDRNPRKRMIGTRYAFGDTYREVMAREAMTPRIHTATHNSQMDGDPVFLTPAELAAKQREMGPYVASAQLYQNPTHASKMNFQRAWLEYRYGAELSWEGMTRVLICDPANSKTKKSDYTTMAVLGLNHDKKYYLLDFLRDRLNLSERASEYFRLHKKWRPHHAAYEEYGLQADTQHLESLMDGGNGKPPYHFRIEIVSGKLSKADRVNRLIPVCKAGDFWMPENLFRTNSEGKLEELISVLIEQEFLAWPVPVHDDGIDVISRVFDIEHLSFPDPEAEPTRDDRYNRHKTQRRGTWMSY